MSKFGLSGAGVLRDHWPEYLIEAWALGMFMISAGVFTMIIEQPQLPLRHLIEDAGVRRLLIGLAMGATAVGLIYSPWGKRSGAHMNPAVTLAFLRLGTVHRWDAAYYILFQTLGGLAGVLCVALLFGSLFADPPVNFVVTVPGKAGSTTAFFAELAMSALLMFTILVVSNHAKWQRFTGLAAGILVATYIAVEAPLSGMSINPARTIASALPAGNWTGWWLYMVGPVMGMLIGVELHRICWPRVIVRRAKLAWSDKQRCIHSGYKPSASDAECSGLATRATDDTSELQEES